MTDRTLHLNLARSTDNDKCDGCKKAAKIYMSGIESCCGGGCYRRLCRECVKHANDLLSKRYVVADTWATFPPYTVFSVFDQETNTTIGEPYTDKAMADAACAKLNGAIA